MVSFVETNNRRTCFVVNVPKNEPLNENILKSNFPNCKYFEYINKDTEKLIR